MQQDLIENTYLSVLLTTFFFPFSFLGLRFWILSVGFFLLLFFLLLSFLIGFFPFLGCESKANCRSAGSKRRRTLTLFCLNPCLLGYFQALLHSHVVITAAVLHNALNTVSPWWVRDGEICLVGKREWKIAKIMSLFFLPNLFFPGCCFLFPLPPQGLWIPRLRYD